MEAVNELLRQLPFQFDIRTQLEDDLARLSQADQARLRVPLPLGNFALYYPVSFYDELGLSPIEHRPTTPLDLIKAIKENYRTEVPKATLQYYAKKRPETYQEFLGRTTPVRLFELVGGRHYIDSISPFRLIGPESDHPRFLLNLIF